MPATKCSRFSPSFQTARCLSERVGRYVPLGFHWFSDELVTMHMVSLSPQVVAGVVTARPLHRADHDATRIKRNKTVRAKLRGTIRRLAPSPLFFNELE